MNPYYPPGLPDDLVREWYEQLDAAVVAADVPLQHELLGHVALAPS